MPAIALMRAAVPCVFVLRVIMDAISRKIEEVKMGSLKLRKRSPWRTNAVLKNAGFFRIF
jgi:hypothetical protein